MLTQIRIPAAIRLLPIPVVRRKTTVHLRITLIPQVLITTVVHNSSTPVYELKAIHHPQAVIAVAGIVVRAVQPVVAEAAVIAVPPLRVTVRPATVHRAITPATRGAVHRPRQEVPVAAVAAAEVAEAVAAVRQIEAQEDKRI
jgi:hypothetical protein